jgi:hypothetical protein
MKRDFKDKQIYNIVFKKIAFQNLRNKKLNDKRLIKLMKVKPIGLIKYF